MNTTLFFPESTTVEPLAATGPRLCVRRPGVADREVSLACGKWTIGSSPRCQVRLDGTGVKPLQCLMVLQEQSATITRWASGVLLNGREFRSATLRAGDKLSIGTWEIEIAGVDGTGRVDAAAQREAKTTAATKVEKERQAPAPPPVAEVVESPASTAGSTGFEDRLVLDLWRSQFLARGRCRTLVAALRARQQEVDATASAIVVIAEELAATRAEAAATNVVSAEIEAAQSEVVALQGQVAELQDALQQNRAELNSGREECARLSAELTAEVERCSAATTRLAGLAEVESQLSATVAQRDCQLAEATAELDALRRELTESQNAAAELTEQLAREVARSEAAANRLAQAESQDMQELSATSAELDGLRAELTASRAECGRLTEELAAEVARSETAAHRLTELESRESQLASELAERDSVLGETTGELDLLRRELTASNSATAGLTEQLAREVARSEAAASRLVEAESRELQFESAVEQRDSRLVETSAEVEALRRELAESCAASTRLVEMLESQPAAPTAESAWEASPNESATFPAAETLTEEAAATSDSLSGPAEEETIANDAWTSHAADAAELIDHRTLALDDSATARFEPEPVWEVPPAAELCDSFVPKASAESADSESYAALEAAPSCSKPGEVVAPLWLAEFAAAAPDNTNVHAAPDETLSSAPTGGATSFTERYESTVEVVDEVLESPHGAPEPTVAELEADPASDLPPASAESTSFIEKYKHLLEEGGEIASPPFAKTQLVDEEFQSPRHAPEPARVEEDDEGLDAYMAKMMERVRGGVSEDKSPKSSAAASKAKPVVPATPVVAEPPRIVPRDYATAEEYMAAATAAHQPVDIEALRRRERRQTQTTDMSALRELANSSANTAIASSREKRSVEVAYGKVLMCGVFAIAAALLMNNAPEVNSLQFWAGIGCGVFGLMSATQLINVSRRREKDRSEFIHAAKDRSGVRTSIVRGE